MNAEPKQRTLSQNRALHKLFEIISWELNMAGLDIATTFQEGIDLPWTPIMVKELLWRPSQRIMLNKESTADLETKEIDIVFEPIAKFLAQKGLEVHFPTSRKLCLKTLIPRLMISNETANAARLCMAIWREESTCNEDEEPPIELVTHVE